MNKIGIMQGRLTAPKGRGIQFYPNYENEIEEEFFKAKELGFDSIEWLITEDSLKNNLFLGSFLHQGFIQNLTFEISVNSICLDYLKDLDLNKEEILNYATQSIDWVANIANNIGCKILIIPIYEKNMNFILIKDLISSVLEKYAIKITFEFLDVNSFTGINFINDLYFTFGTDFNRDDKIGVCFDIGNNYNKNIIVELEKYNKYNMLYHIHIKEKTEEGLSVKLGSGVISWEFIFQFLKEINYLGNFVLEVAREKEGDEFGTVKRQLEFIGDYLNG